jgi:hypothetical protein
VHYSTIVSRWILRGRSDGNPNCCRGAGEGGCGGDAPQDSWRGPGKVDAVPAAPGAHGVVSTASPLTYFFLLFIIFYK